MRLSQCLLVYFVYTTFLCYNIIRHISISCSHLSGEEILSSNPLDVTVPSPAYRDGEPTIELQAVTDTKELPRITPRPTLRQLVRDVMRSRLIQGLLVGNGFILLVIFGLFLGGLWAANEAGVIPDAAKPGFLKSEPTPARTSAPPRKHKTPTARPTDLLPAVKPTTGAAQASRTAQVSKSPSTSTPSSPTTSASVSAQPETSPSVTPPASPESTASTSTSSAPAPTESSPESTPTGSASETAASPTDGEASASPAAGVSAVTP